MLKELNQSPHRKMTMNGDTSTNATQGLTKKVNTIDSGMVELLRPSPARKGQRSEEYVRRDVSQPDVPPKTPSPMPPTPLERFGVLDILKNLGNMLFARPKSQTSWGGTGGAEGSSYLARLVWRRWIFLGLVALTTAAGTLQLASVLQSDGFTIVEMALLSVFTALFSWITISFWITLFGLLASRRGAHLDNLTRLDAKQISKAAGRSRTALVMPIYNEDVPRVFAGLKAVCESLRASEGQEKFDVFVLSDSNDPDCARKEEVHWRTLRKELAGHIDIYYRRRTDNKGRKSGNIEEFCENWGDAYNYMIVLDADSVMTGATLRNMVRLMDANGRVGLIQVPPSIVGGGSLFARFQQFSSSVYGPVFARGLAYLQGPDGNYWGHNAIIRVCAFKAHCSLPVLPGRAPLGGEILSHDFVEAALLRRAGWEVWMVPNLGGSFEETPQTIDDYLARDRRWCQGNLQHAKLLRMKGLRTASRLHFVMGIMSYVSSPLWLAMLVLSLAQAYFLRAMPAFTYSGTYPVLNFPISHFEELVLLVSATFLLLFGPKVFGTIALLFDRARLRAHGGSFKVFLGVLCECVFSILFAPIAMLAHTWFVVNNLIGRSVGWNAQQRDSRRVPFSDAVRAFAPHTVIGLVFGSLAYLANPETIWWLVPFLAGLMFAVPLVYVVCGIEEGAAFRRANLLMIPIERSRNSIIDRVKRLAVRKTSGRAKTRHRNGLLQLVTAPAGS